MAERKMQLREEIEKAVYVIKSSSEGQEKALRQRLLDDGFTYAAASAAAKIEAEERGAERQTVVDTLRWVLGDNEVCPFYVTTPKGDSDPYLMKDEKV